jgi:hypothetical protein
MDIITPWLESASEIYRLNEPSPLVGEGSANISGQRVSRGQRNNSPTVVNFGFLDRSRYFLDIAPQLSSRGWVYPVPDPLFLRQNLVAPGIEPGPLDLYPGTLTTRPQRRCMDIITNIKFHTSISQDINDTLNYETIHLTVDYYIIYFHVTRWHLTVCCYGDLNCIIA